MEDEPNRIGQAAGFLTSLGSALVTGFLLFLNGGVVLAGLNALSSGGLVMLRNESFSQFVVLVCPVILVVFEWMMIDYLKTKLIRRRSQSET